MTKEWKNRTAALYGSEFTDNLGIRSVAVFGLGGVGGFAAEALSRTGIGSIDLFDSDVFDPSNLNRQIGALNSTIGKNKSDIMAARLADINPDLNINAYNIFVAADNLKPLNLQQYDYVIDAVDTVSSKIEIIKECKRYAVPIVAAMGAANKKHPELLEIADIFSTSVCPLAKIMRKKLSDAGIDSLDVVYSKEKPQKNDSIILASSIFVPASMGLMLASKVINDMAVKYSGGKNAPN